MDATKNYYFTLGVMPSAEPVVIRAAYRALALQYHPDKWRGAKASATIRMRELNEAFEVLSNAESRKRYDELRREKKSDDYEAENASASAAFGEAEQAQVADWTVATEYFPDLDSIYTKLKRTSSKLAFAFRPTILASKHFNERLKLAEQLENDFMRTYFGRNKQILDFARKLINAGDKSAAKELNRAITVLGDNTDPMVRPIQQRSATGRVLALKKTSRGVL